MHQKLNMKAGGSFALEAKGYKRAVNNTYEIILYIKALLALGVASLKTGNFEAICVLFEAGSVTVEMVL